jgi:hypothetical protein
VPKSQDSSSPSIPAPRGDVSGAIKAIYLEITQAVSLQTTVTYNKDETFAFDK